jgi:hypothetical protein
MSTEVDVLISWWAQRGGLYSLEPRLTRDAKRRRMYVSHELYQAMSTPAESEIEIFARLEATLTDFVTSKTLDPNYIRGLYPARDGVWAIRSVEPHPSIRVLGLFPLKDVFVATNFAKRKELGGFESKEWRAARRRAKTVWRQLFTPYPYLDTRDVNQLFSGALNGNYFKK